MRVAISGAGPTGLTAAVELARHGIEVEVFDKREAPSGLSRAVGLQPRSIESLRPSGAAEAILAEAITFSGVTFHRGARPIATLPLNFDQKSKIWGLAQDRTEAHLREALQRYGQQVHYGEAFTSARQDKECVHIQNSAREFKADYLIGADGVQSAVRQDLGLAFPGFDLPVEWSIADVVSDTWHRPEELKGYLLDQGDVCVVVPLETNRFRVIASRPDALAALPVPMEVKELRRSGAFIISVRQVEQYQHGRIFLAGDAAHCHSPVGGRGMNLGIADAAELARRIADGTTEGYHAARHPEGQHVLRFSENGRRMINTTSIWRRGLAMSAIWLGGNVPPLGRRMIGQFANG